MLLNRLDGQMPADNLSALPSETLKNFFYDTVGWGSKPALRAAAEAFGAGNLLPGSDWPVLLRWESYAQTFAHISECGLPQADVDAILFQNVRRLLGDRIERGMEIMRSRSRLIRN